MMSPRPSSPCSRWVGSPDKPSWLTVVWHCTARSTPTDRFNDCVPSGASRSATACQERLPGITDHQNIFRRILRVAPAVWRDPIELAQPTAADVPATLESAGIAY